jgi:hypothetical protein
MGDSDGAPDGGRVEGVLENFYFTHGAQSGDPSTLDHGYAG